MTRILAGLSVGVVFAAGWILDPAGVVQLAYVCATGGCGVRPLWLAMAVGAGLAVCMAVALARRMLARRAAARRPRAGGRRKRGSAATAKRLPRRATRARK